MARIYLALAALVPIIMSGAEAAATGYSPAPQPQVDSGIVAAANATRIRGRREKVATIDELLAGITVTATEYSGLEELEPYDDDAAAGPAAAFRPCEPRKLSDALPADWLDENLAGYAVHDGIALNCRFEGSIVVGATPCPPVLIAGIQSEQITANFMWEPKLDLLDVASVAGGPVTRPHVRKLKDFATLGCKLDVDSKSLNLGITCEIGIAKTPLKLSHTVDLGVSCEDMLDTFKSITATQPDIDSTSGQGDDYYGEEESEGATYHIRHYTVRDDGLYWYAGPVADEVSRNTLYLGFDTDFEGGYNSMYFEQIPRADRGRGGGVWMRHIETGDLCWAATGVRDPVKLLPCDNSLEQEWQVYGDEHGAVWYKASGLSAKLKVDLCLEFNTAIYPEDSIKGTAATLGPCDMQEDSIQTMMILV